MWEILLLDFFDVGQINRQAEKTYDRKLKEEEVFAKSVPITNVSFHHNKTESLSQDFFKSSKSFSAELENSIPHDRVDDEFQAFTQGRVDVERQHSIFVEMQRQRQRKVRNFVDQQLIACTFTYKIYR